MMLIWLNSPVPIKS